MMSSLLLLVGLSSSPLVLPAGSDYFPGSYYDASVRQQMHSAALAWWPAPSRLLEIWEDGALDAGGQVVFLLSAAAFRDPDLLPAYLDGLRSSDPRVRQAAAYGYRDLIGDALPDVRAGVDEGLASALEGEIRAVAATLRVNPLVAMWVQAGLATEGAALPGWRGVVMQRPAAACWLSVDRLLQPEDLDLIVTAYRLSEEPSNRGALLLLIEGLTLERFVDRSRGPRQGRGQRDEALKFDRLETWIARSVRPPSCRLDAAKVLQRRFAEVGASSFDPFGAESCVIWQQLLVAGEPSWWAPAARRLFDCGGPGLATRLSILWAESAEIRKARDELMRWYRLKEPGVSSSRAPGAGPPASRPTAPKVQ